MSSPIAATPTSIGPTAVRDVSMSARSEAATATQVTGSSEEAVALQTLPSNPPPEVLSQMAGAARAYDELAAQGRELRFAQDASSGRTEIEVRDRAGNLLSRLSPAQALDLAAGGPLE